MTAKRTIIEDDQSLDDPVLVRTTKRVIDPEIHTPVVDDHEQVINSTDKTTVHRSRTVHEPLIQTQHPQKVYEAKKAIFRLDQLVWFALIIIESLLALRVTFLAIGANPFSGFVSFIYAVSDLLVMPFEGIIRSTSSGNSVLEWSTIIAAFIYALIAWGVVTLIHLARPVTPEEVEMSV